MADNTLDILIRIIANEEGQEKADQILKRYTEETKKSGVASEDAGKKVKLFGEHNKEVKKTIQELSREFPIAGLALRAFANPIAAALTISVGFFVAIKRHIDETNRALDEFEREGAEAIGANEDALEQFRLKTIEAGEEFAKYQQTVAENSGRILSDIKAQHEALITILNAEQALAIARSGDPDKTKEQFRQLEIALGLREKSAVIAEKEAELQEVIRKGGEKFATAGGALGTTSPESAKLALSTIPDTIARVDEMIKREEARQKSIPATIDVARGRRRSTLDKLLDPSLITHEEVNPDFAASESKLAGMRRYRGSLGAEQERLTRGITAAGETESLGQSLRGLQTELAHLHLGTAAEGAAEPRRQMAALESERQKVGAIADAAESAGDWIAWQRAANAMDSIAANIKILAEKAVKADAAVNGAMQIMGNMRRQ